MTGADQSAVRRTTGVGLALLLVAGVLLARAVTDALGPEGFAATGLPRLAVSHALLPRAVVALAAGAALGLAGALFQRTLRNPVADASTLGVAPGANFAIALATLIAPDLGGLSREAVALGGGLAAAGLVLGLAWRQAFAPATVAVAGMLVGLVCASASAAVVLFSGQYLLSLFLWGGGSLAQQDWGPALGLLWRLALGGALAAVLARPLALLALGEGGASGLGLAVARARAGLLLLAVALAASVVSAVGLVGFVGLAAPNLARMLGIRTPRGLLVAAPWLGAAMLGATDGIVQAIDRSAGLNLPTGAVTALFAGPFLLLLLPRLPTLRVLPAAARAGERRAPVGRLLVLAALTCALILACGLLLGRDADGLQLAGTDTLGALLPWRAPRLVAAAAGGAMLAAAGCALQRLTGNPLASPEVLGVSGAASLGLALGITLAPGLDLAGQIGVGALGALIGLAALLLVARRGAGGGGSMLLGGIALGALSGSCVTLLLTRGGMEATVILGWLTGSTAGVTPTLACVALAAALLIVAALALLVRWLDLLPLGEAIVPALGLPPARSRLVLLTLTALAAGVSTLVVGPVSFVGLMAPHLARALGLRPARRHLAGSVVLGAGLMAAADVLARLTFFPYQMPVGLFASLVGAPYLVWSATRRRDGQGG